jgi:hypothetical protein
MMLIEMKCCSPNKKPTPPPSIDRGSERPTPPSKIDSHNRKSFSHSVTSPIHRQTIHNAFDRCARPQSCCHP